MVSDNLKVAIDSYQANQPVEEVKFILIATHLFFSASLGLVSAAAAGIKSEPSCWSAYSAAAAYSPYHAGYAAAAMAAMAAATGGGDHISAAAAASSAAGAAASPSPSAAAAVAN